MIQMLPFFSIFASVTGISKCFGVEVISGGDGGGSDDGGEDGLLIFDFADFVRLCTGDGMFSGNI